MEDGLDKVMDLLRDMKVIIIHLHRIIGDDGETADVEEGPDANAWKTEVWLPSDRVQVLGSGVSVLV